MDKKKEAVENTEKTETKNNKGLVITLFIVIGLLFLSLIGCIVVIYLRSRSPRPVIDNNKITITFDADGGLEVEKITFDKGTTVELPESTKEGFTFSGWFNGEKQYKTEDTAKLEKDIKLTAKWEELKADETVMTINFDAQGGKVSTNKSKTAQTVVKCTDNVYVVEGLPTATKDGYSFMAWADKNGTPILNGASLICSETLDLYATYEKKSEPTKTAKCPSGYVMNQDGTKCVQNATAEKYCDGNWKLVNGECVNPNSPNPKGTRTCPEKTYGGWTGTGTYYEAGRGYCGYYELHSYIGQRDNCKNNGGTLAANNHCYKYTEVTYKTTCAADEKMFASQVIAPGNGGGCYQVSTAKNKCPDGYSNNTGYGDCVKLADPIYE